MFNPKAIADLFRGQDDLQSHLQDNLQQTLRKVLPGIPGFDGLARRHEPGEDRADLVEGRDFGANPGALRMWSYIPANLPKSAALVVVLHGCTQTAAGYNAGTGWSALADRHGFALLFPEQRHANNSNGCFNWFQPADTRRGKGEVASIRDMVAAMVRDHAIDPARIFVTGLSAGGAMTSALLATYPDVFAGGAIIAGLPYGAANSVQEAFKTMYQPRARPEHAWGDLVRAASPHTGRWPRVSVWHGSADATVRPMNGEEVIKQWRDVHGLPATPTQETTVDGYPRQVWRDRDDADVIESFTIAGMAHGTPLAVGDGDEEYGAAGPFLLDVGISSSFHIAQFWGLTGRVRAAPRVSKPAAKPASAPAPAASTPERAPAAAPAFNISGMIVRALTKAGLMR